MPLGFEANRGQSDSRVRFLSRGSGYGVFLTPDEIVLALGGPSAASTGHGHARSAASPARAGAAVLRMSIVGASSGSRLRGLDPLAGKVNYLLGKDPARWRTGIDTYGRVVNEDIYPGIDLVLHGNQGALEYDFVVAPGADPDAIALAFAGARDLSLTPEGDLSISTAAGRVRQRAPFVYQNVEGSRRAVSGAFALHGRRVGFRLGAYDQARPLVIDPVLEYSTFLGGATSYDAAAGLTVDASGAAYVAGHTFSADFPTTAGAFDATRGELGVCAPAQDPGFEPPPVDTCLSDAFLTKLSPDGSALAYSTFLGGDRSDRALDIAVDEDGSAYVTGGTNSSDFPTTPGAPDGATAGNRRVMGVGLVVLAEAFLVKLSPDGASLAYSTFLGGGDADEAMGVKVDASGAASVAGHTFSSDYPTTAGAFDPALNTPGTAADACSDVFVTTLNPTGDSLAHSTYLGGSRLEFGWDLALDEAGSAYIMGETTSRDLPTTPAALQGSGHVHSETAGCGEPLEQFDDADPFVAKLEPDGSGLVYSTYLGGSGHEHGHAIAVRSGAAYVAGHTNSPDFPTTPGAFDRTFDGTDTASDSFVAKLSPGGNSLAYSTYLGGEGDDWGFDIAADSGGSAYVTGVTASSDFPTTPDAMDNTYIGPGAPFYDAFLTRLSGDGSKLLYSTYFGGGGPDIGNAIVLDRKGSAYVAGSTFSPDLPVTVGAFSPLFKGPLTYTDAFVAKFSGLSEGAGRATREAAGLAQGRQHRVVQPLRSAQELGEPSRWRSLRLGPR